MERTTVRDLHIRTSALIKEVAEGQTFVIEKRGVPVAELRPLQTRRKKKPFPDREAFFKTLPQGTDIGRILEEDRT